MLFEKLHARNKVSSMEDRIINDVIYSFTKRQHPSLGEYPWFWLGTDGTEVELDDEGIREWEGMQERMNLPGRKSVSD